ncbi:hypothetical protein BDB00DRAFT_864295 [Zychaea mexicana]|uniref:uncharacterized protein n=1 Tax=Zychaea mexicana TaxID=64656 RepID=UPI0022FE930F|nr:uncharacterized protein BDB00DRAFT_864295 [Zychaea mexicana]KAI9467995.1 hypothetical protein BDB00DRAFT_864295 [Zychaea mexicana]
MMMVFIVYVLLIFFTRRAFFLFIYHFHLIGRCSAIVTLHLCQFSDHFLQDKKYIIP